MSIPVKGLGSMNSVNSMSGYTGFGGGNSHTLERPKPTVGDTLDNLPIVLWVIDHAMLFNR